MTDPLMLVDGASMWFRAFHALPEKLTAPDGRPVNAVRGFTDMLSALIRREQPGRVVVCLDRDWRPRFRVEVVPSYKAHRVAAGEPEREDAPPALGPQVPLILDLLAAAGIATAGADGCEADDVIGTLASRESSAPVVVVSGDRDLLQVVRDEPTPVRVLYVGRGLAKAELFGTEDVAERYGVLPRRSGPAYAELALLRGDPSDGLPGVPGIGEKTAARLLTEFGDLAALRAAVGTTAAERTEAETPTPETPTPETPTTETVTPQTKSALTARLRARLSQASDYLDAALPVVRVITDADVDLSRADTLPASPADPAALDRIAADLGIERVVERLTAALAGD